MTQTGAEFVWSARRMAKVGGVGFVFLWAVACVTHPPKQTEPIQTAAQGSAPIEATQKPPAALSAESVPGESRPTAEVESVQLLEFRRELEQPVRWISLGSPPRVAVIANEPWLFDGKAWKELPIPPRYRAASGDVDTVGIYFGRDDKPRLMGARKSGGNTSAVYLRWKQGRWQREPGEIGRLGGAPAGGLFGVLGQDDPEIVCKAGDVCIVKRRTGWTTIPAGKPARVFLCQGQPWALYADNLARLGPKGWEPFAPRAPWRHPSGFWEVADTVWVSVAGKPGSTGADGDSVYRLRGKWERHPSPIAGPRALWASSPNDVWLVGDGGVAHYNGVKWRRVRGVDGPLVAVTGRAAGVGGAASDVWVGGPKGLWLGQSRPRQRPKPDLEDRR